MSHLLSTKTEGNRQPPLFNDLPWCLTGNSNKTARCKPSNCADLNYLEDVPI